MILIVFIAVYAVCTTLLVAVVWQDRRRAPQRQGVPDPRSTQVPTFVFRTQA